MKQTYRDRQRNRKYSKCDERRNQVRISSSKWIQKMRELGLEKQQNINELDYLIYIKMIDEL